MKKYAIVFGKDPEYIDGCEWPDMCEDTSEFEKEWVAGKFETDEEDLFWQMFLNVRLHPCAMWYWIVIDGVTFISGAIDPDDINSLAEGIDIPDWVWKENNRMEASWDDNKYGELYNKDLEDED